MILRKSCMAGLALASIVAISTPAHAIKLLPGKKKQTDDTGYTKPTPAQNQLIDRAIAREAEVIKVLKERSPLTEVYIQTMKPDPELLQVPESDQHFLGRISFSKVIGDTSYQASKSSGSGGKFGFFKNSLGYLTGLGKALNLEFNEAGFMQMLLVDSKDFDREHYNFFFVRNDFLGSVPTTIFDVQPAKGGYGRFFGRIWIERRGGNIVRFNGSFNGSQATHSEYYHFDSWRTNVQPDIWLPNSFYVEESNPKVPGNIVKFKATGHVWGYALKVPEKEVENTSVEVQGATDVSNEAQDVSPLGAQREWVQQAEDNVIDRLTKAGLLAAPSEFDKTLEALANNILAYNQIPLSRPIRVRTLLTEPLESLAIGNTVLLSKSLIDTTAVVTADGAQQAGNLNAILAFGVAHVILGHRLDTKYAFSDRLLFPDTSAFTHIPMHHTDKDNEEAAKKTVELLNAKELQEASGYFGLYLQQLAERVKALPDLNKPMIGDGLTKSEKDTTFWLAAIQAKGQKLDVKDLKQMAAMPLGSFLKFDPWTDQVITLHAAQEPILNPRDKMPFEITPVYMRLSYYTAPAAPAAGGATAAPQQAAPPAAQDAAPAAAPPAAGTATPPQN
ncbi:hypothetical protein [Terriglobus tenax]|uniref:hypothetical protein n=1 Tax=Terriglobus tenax TaxID=1111115 RepID=UPI0021DFA25F|nr:hypothetical protein [Terriglobus tenax]